VVEPACPAGRSLPSKQMVAMSGQIVSSVELEWVVYVLRSAKDSGFYVGMTANLERRVREHNAGQNRSTKSRTPFEVIYVERCGSRTRARAREKYLKSGAGRELLKTLPLAVNTSGGNSVVESLPSKQMVAGSSPVPRSKIGAMASELRGE
jgi:putative endonuclease